MDKDQARRALAEWAADRQRSDQQRNVVVPEAFRAGVPKKEIHLITGLARTTINKILQPSGRQEGTGSGEPHAGT